MAVPLQGTRKRISKQITLEFDLKKGDRMVALPFYQHISDSIQEAAGLEAKAKNWEMMLSKMMTKEIKV